MVLNKKANDLHSIEVVAVLVLSSLLAFALDRTTMAFINVISGVSVHSPWANLCLTCALFVIIFIIIDLSPDIGDYL